jgi:ABC-2 type transport system permease protein
MLMEAKIYLKLIWAYFKFNISSIMEYRASFLIQSFGMVINNGSFIFFWWVLFTKTSSIGGYGFKDVMLIWALASSCFGLSHVLFGNVGRITEIIINGELDVYMLQPKNILINVIASRSILSSWGDLFYGYILFFITYGLDITKLSLFTLFVVLGTLIFASTFIIAHSLTFFIGNSSGLSDLISEFMISLSIYPEGIYKSVIVKFIIFTIIPAGFLTMIPVRIFNIFNIKLLLGLFLIDIFYCFLAFKIFMLGLKRYESGNLITTKL